MRFGQVAATSQFYLYGRRHCTATGYEKARAALLKEGPDLLQSADLSLVVCLPSRRSRHTRHPLTPIHSPLAPAPTLLIRASRGRQGKVAMVTGANSGVGFEVAQYLARRGAEVHLVCRSAKRGEEARQAMIAASGNSKVHLLVCDCSLEADVRRLGEPLTLTLNPNRTPHPNPSPSPSPSPSPKPSPKPN